MFIFGLVVLVVNDFVDFNFMSSNYRKRRRSMVHLLARSFFPRLCIVSYKKRLGREDKERKVEKRKKDRKRASGGSEGGKVDRY